MCKCNGYLLHLDCITFYFIASLVTVRESEKKNKIKAERERERKKRNEREKKRKKGNIELELRWRKRKRERKREREREETCLERMVAMPDWSVRSGQCNGPQVEFFLLVQVLRVCNNDSH